MNLDFLKGEITDYDQACYEFESKQELQQIWYDEGYTKILKPNCFRIEEHSREYSMSDTIIHNTLEYAETRFRRLIGEYLLGYVRINQGLYMTEFGKKFGYSRMKISKIENIGYDLSKKELETIHKVLKIK